QFLFGALGEVGDDLGLGLAVDLRGQRFNRGLDSRPVRSVGLLELVQQIPAPLGELLHLAVFVLAQNFAVLDRVFVIAAEIIKQRDQPFGIVLSEGRGRRCGEERQQAQKRWVEKSPAARAGGFCRRKSEARAEHALDLTPRLYYKALM